MLLHNTYGVSSSEIGLLYCHRVCVLFCLRNKWGIARFIIGKLRQENEIQDSIDVYIIQVKFTPVAETLSFRNHHVVMALPDVFE